ncbi:MAG: KilA-N domain-containing protein [Ignavibacteriae bacterium]|nr:KilA-N domain-containing protein [Ignavibacteriota bacterium]
MKAKTKIIVKGIEVVLFNAGNEDYISLTDIAKYRDSERSDYILQNWMRNRSTIEFIGLWEILHNPNFKSIEFDGFKHQAGSNSFSLTPKRWIESTNAIGIISKSGRYGGTYAHQDIALEFASWISPEFKLYLIKEYQRLKIEESQKLQLEWKLSRTLARVNYHIHTDAIRENLIPPDFSQLKQKFVYASEADLLNLALFGKTAKEWRDVSPGKVGNIRDYAAIEQLIVLTNLESLNAVLINQGINAEDRLKLLNKTAISQMKVLINQNVAKKLLNP